MLSGVYLGIVELSTREVRKMSNTLAGHLGHTVVVAKSTYTDQSVTYTLECHQCLEVIQREEA